ncbi:MAG: RNA polymerase sigma factor [Limisphaerales bacterium]
MNSEFSNRAFAPTRWTLVLRCRGDSEEARAALSELCSIYYRPVFEFLKHDCGDEEKARELAHEFFARILQSGGIDNVDPQRGRFRSYLLGALKHFIIERRRFENRKKRGGDAIIESIDAVLETEESTLQCQINETTQSFTEYVFDYNWAITVVARALESVEKRYREEGREQVFETLKIWLTGAIEGNSQSEAAAKLGLSESAIKVAIHRLRKRFREAVKFEISQTIPETDNVEEELKYLIEVLARNLNENRNIRL